MDPDHGFNLVVHRSHMRCETSTQIGNYPNAWKSIKVVSERTTKWCHSGTTTGKTWIFKTFFFGLPSLFENTHTSRLKRLKCSPLEMDALGHRGWSHDMQLPSLMIRFENLKMEKRQGKFLQIPPKALANELWQMEIKRNLEHIYIYIHIYIYVYTLFRLTR